VLRATQTIQVDKEISISYCEPKPYLERKFTLSKWGFECKCSLCESEKKICDTNYYNFVVKKLEKLREYLSKLNVTDPDNFSLNLEKDQKLFQRISKWVEKIVLSSEDDNYYLINFIFFKNISKIISQNKQFSIYCIEKSIKYIESKSKRELFELLLHYFTNFRSELFQIKSKEIQFEIMNLISLHYSNEKDVAQFILKLD
jgi:hypothetical protein